VRKATADEIKQVVRFVDGTFTKEGYGFVTSSQILTETKRGAVWVAVAEGDIIGVRIGLRRVYNLAVHPLYRKLGVGRALLDVQPPEEIRVKSMPVGNLSKEQRDNFANPEGFYEKLGYVYTESDFARNFWQRGKRGERAHYHKEGKIKHIKIYVREDVLIDRLVDAEQKSS
jgi:GNAT superfamily N-acetyltransferase